MSQGYITSPNTTEGFVRFDTFEEEAININNIENSFLKNECSICLEAIETDNYSILDSCFHKFHEKCIQNWFNKCKQYRCPECNIINPDRIIVKIDRPRKCINTKKRRNKNKISLEQPIELANSNTSYKRPDNKTNKEEQTETCSRICGCIIL